MTDMQPENKDLYLNVYNKIFGVNRTELTKEERRKAQTMVFTHLYGGRQKSIINIQESNEK